MTPSPQQEAFYSWVNTAIGSAVLEAVAGAGKTTTLIQALSLMKGTIFLGAFNKKIADEIAERAPKKPGLTISTMHAAGFRAWRKVASKVQVENFKCKNIFRGACATYPEYIPFEQPVLKLVSLAKQAAIGVGSSIKDHAKWLELIDHFDIEVIDELTDKDNTALVVKLAIKVLEHSIATDMDVVDFDDMIFAPLIHNTKLFEHDWVLIDEAQDTNASRRALALRMLKRGGRLVAVGDRAQAIYGFTGSDNDSLDLIGKAVNAKYLPLTVTFRCPKLIVAHAKKWVNHIEAHESAPEGKISQSNLDELYKIAVPGDAVLCRFNKPLVECVYKFIAKGIPAKIEGKEIGEGLKALATRWKIKTFDALYAKLDTFREKEVAKYRAKEQEAKAAAIEDRIDCLIVIIQRVQLIDPNYRNVIERIVQEIDSIFADNDTEKKPVVLLSTIHKSKGREWDNVFWLQTGPSPWARKQWEMDQENNLCYVATTRAKKHLILVAMEEKKK